MKPLGDLLYCDEECTRSLYQVLLDSLDSMLIYKYLWVHVLCGGHCYMVIIPQHLVPTASMVSSLQPSSLTR